MNLTDTKPRIEVAENEFKRLLGLPPEYPLRGRVAELAQWAREWYAENGRPWIFARLAEEVKLEPEAVRVEGTPLHSPELRKRMERAEANAGFVVAVGAGPELEREAARCWEEDRPDEYFFLEIYGSAVVEHLTMGIGARLCDWADRQGMAALPHYSPGYQGWDLTDQPKLLELVRGRNGHPALPGPLEVLDSGMLRPKKSQLAFFGLTRRTDLTRRLTELIPCQGCAYPDCAYRRTPYQPVFNRFAGVQELEQYVMSETDTLNSRTGPLRADGPYAFSVKALERWSQERLKYERGADGEIVATFRFDGSTCSNMGVPLAFDYVVRLAGPLEGYRINGADCQTVAGEEGYKAMCAFKEDRYRFMEEIQGEKPLLGRPLDEVLDWNPNISPAGCLCTRTSRDHKWRVVLQTIHYRLVRDEEKSA